MRRVLPGRMTAYLGLLVILELGLIPVLPWAGFRPSLLYLMVPYVAFEWHRRYLIPTAIAVGILRDLTGSLPFGVETAALFISGWLFGFLILKIERYFFLMRSVSTFVYLAMVPFLALALSQLIGRPFASAPSLILGVLSSAACLTLLMPFFVAATKRWFGERQALKQFEFFT